MNSENGDPGLSRAELAVEEEVNMTRQVLYNYIQTRSVIIQGAGRASILV